MTQVYEEGDVERLERVARAALGRYALPADAGVELINLSENATYLVTPPGADVPTVLRVHRASYSSPAEIASELAWAAALRDEAAIRTPPVRAAADGTPVVMVAVDEWAEPRACVMFDFCPGSEPSEEEMPASFERLGTIAARMHDHARGWTPPPWFVRRTWDHETTVGDSPHWGRWQDGMGVGREEHDLLARLAGTLGERLRRYGAEPERFGLVHADMRLANLLFDGPETYVIDFDDCGYSWYLYDLATAFTFIEDREDVAALIAAWLRGYREVRAPTAADVGAIPTLVMLRRLLVLAWIGSHANTELARTEGIPYTRVTCELAEAYLRDSLPWIDGWHVVTRQTATAPFDADWFARYVSEGLREGTLIPGQRLGSERELAIRFRTTRTSLRRALVPLERRGLVRRVSGRGGGTFVGDFTLERDLSTIVGVAQYLRQQGFEPGTRVLRAGLVEADDITAHALEIAPGSVVVDLLRVRSANELPIVLEHSRLPADRFPGLLELPLGGSVLELLAEHYGLVPGEATEMIEAVNARPEEARVLDVEVGAALMAVTRTATAEEGFIFEYSHDLFRGDHTRVVVRAPAGPQGAQAGEIPRESADVRVLPYGRGRRAVSPRLG